MSRRIYFGGDILTLEGEGRADYLVAENGKIKGAGKGTPPVLSADTEKIDLKGRTLLPAFIDPHSHISACASKFLQLDLENCKTNEKIEKAIAQFISENKTPCGEWVFASGYDHTRVEGKRLTAELLDRAAPDNPLVVQYQSGHMGIFNSAAMKLLGVAADTKPLEGGVIERNADGAPTGYMEETDFVTRLQSVPMPDGKKLLGAFDRAQELYFSNGIVMMQEGLGVKELLPLYQGIAAAGRLKADVVIYPDLAAYEAYAEAIPARLSCGSGSLKLGGVKLISDGSPQGRTAWMRTPYLDESGRPESDGYCGYPSVSQKRLKTPCALQPKKASASRPLQRGQGRGKIYRSGNKLRRSRHPSRHDSRTAVGNRSAGRAQARGDYSLLFCRSRSALGRRAYQKFRFRTGFEHKSPALRVKKGYPFHFASGFARHSARYDRNDLVRRRTKDGGRKNAGRRRTDRCILCA